MSRWGLFLIDKQSDNKATRCKILDLAEIYRLPAVLTEKLINGTKHVVFDLAGGLGLGGILSDFHIPRHVSFEDDIKLMAEKFYKKAVSIKADCDFNSKLINIKKNLLRI